MIKVMWFLKRADHLSLEEFHRWWTETHAPAVVAAQRPYLKRYVIDLRWPDDPLPGKPADEMDWDGVAEQWFETEDDFKAVYARATVSPTRADTLKHVSRHARMLVRENPVEVRGA
jgi:hypothetical protein